MFGVRSELNLNWTDWLVIWDLNCICGDSSDWECHCSGKLASWKNVSTMVGPKLVYLICASWLTDLQCCYSSKQLTDSNQREQSEGVEHPHSARNIVTNLGHRSRVGIKYPPWTSLLHLTSFATCIGKKIPWWFHVPVHPSKVQICWRMKNQINAATVMVPALNHHGNIPLVPPHRNHRAISSQEREICIYV